MRTLFISVIRIGAAWRSLALVAGLAAAPGDVLAQSESSDPGEFASSQDANVYFADRQRAAWRENAERLAEIDQAYADAKRALSEENVRRTKALVAENSAAHKALAERGLNGDEHAVEFRRIQQETRQARADKLAWFSSAHEKLDDDHALRRAEQLAETRATVARLDAQRAATIERLVNSPTSLGGVLTQDAENGVAKSGATGAKNYDDHCDLCHGVPGLRTMPYDLYPAVVEDDADYFLGRVRNGPGPMPEFDGIAALSDAEVLEIRDYVRREGDINTGVVPDPDATKTPDPTEPADTGATSNNNPVAGVPSNLPPISPDSPLPESGPAGSDAVRDAQTAALGSAGLTCNLNGDVDVRWIAPLAWSAGWIPPGADMQASESGWEDNWMVRVRARLEDPTTTDSGGHPDPGWCTFTNGSLGSVAGKSREIAIFAHTTSRVFEQFHFNTGAVDVWRSNASPGDRGGSFAVDVVNTVHGLVMPAGNRSRNTNGEVHGHVKRIDDRWSGSGEPAFLVIND